MNADEMEAARNYEQCDEYEHCKSGELIEGLLAHIDMLQAHENQTHEILGDMLGKGDSLEANARKAMMQIAALKAALISEREARITGSKESKCYPHIGTWKQKDEYSHQEAASQLAQEYPEIFGGME